MFTTRRSKRALALAAVLTAGAVTLSVTPAQAFSPRSEAGISSSQIKLGITLPMTGAASPGYNKVPGAMQAYFNYVNDNGGVYGRKIKLVVKDDGYLPTNAVAKTNELILKDNVFATVGQLGTANNLAIASGVNLGRRGIPSLFVNTGYSGFANAKAFPTTFALLPSYIMEAKIMGQYIKENFAGKKLALIYQDDDFGSDALAGFKAAGVKFDLTIPYASGSQSAATGGAWVSKLKAAGAEVTVMFGVSSATAPALGAAAQLGFKTQWILGSVGGDATTIKALGVPAAILTGAIGASFVPSPGDANDEWVKQFQDINTKYNAGASFDNNVLIGMNSAFLTVEALRAAGKNPTRAGLMAAIASKGSTWASASFAPLNYSAASHVGYNGYWFGTYNPTGNMLPAGGKYVVYTTDSAGGDVVKSTFTRAAMPSKGLPNN
jgi:ABC-type branched-subunit amino acid transport system substrate-binding protein